MLERSFGQSALMYATERNNQEVIELLGALDDPCRQQSIGCNQEVPRVLDAASQASQKRQKSRLNVNPGETRITANGKEKKHDDDKCRCGSCDPLTCGCGSRLYIASSFLCEICEVQLM